MNEDEERPGAVSRRGMFTGVGAALLGTSLAAVGTEAGAAVPHGVDGTAPSEPGRRIGATTPITTTISSAPTSAYIYKIVCMYDFEPFDPDAKKTWGGYGVYSAGTATTMRATLDIPPGCLVREVEYYIRNNSGANFYPDTYLYVPGQGTIWSVGASVAIPSTGSIVAAKAAPTQQGPYPLGARLLVSAATPATGAIQINGARVGFTGAAAGVGTRGAPAQVFNGRLTANSTKTITLPATLIAPGVMGILAALTVSGASGTGALTVFRGDVSRPAQASMHYGTNTATSELTTQLSARRQIKVHTTRAIHLAVDVIGILG